MCTSKKFIDYNEAPIVTSDDSQHREQYIIDETPPPLPPRTHSLLPMAGSGADGILRLNLAGSQTKPLPKIPASVSFNDDLYAPDNDNTNKDALNNFINNERSSEMMQQQQTTNMTNRPLPPLPTQNNSLNRVHESDSDDNEYFENDDDDDDDSEADDIDENQDEDNNGHEVEDMDNANYKSRNKDKHNNLTETGQTIKTNEQNQEHDNMKVNGIETATSGTTRYD